MFARTAFNRIRTVSPAAAAKIRSAAFVRAFSNQSTKRHPKKLVIASLSALAVGSAVYNTTQVQNDASESVDPDSVVSVDSSVSPFPLITEKPLLKSTFQLLGYGVRTVTFLQMKVYALGLYVARDDLPLVSKILDSKFLESLYDAPKDDSLSHSEHLESALKDPKLSTILIENLLNSGVRFAARIVPVRNTDFNHLRDGLVKSIKSNPRYKELVRAEDGSDERLSKGLDELRSVFGSRKMSAFKNSTLVLQLLDNGKLEVSFEQDNKGVKAEPFTMGVVSETLVGKLLFLSYMSGTKPLSEPARSKAVEGFVSIA